jgi:class 3 adenylate cyclase
VPADDRPRFALSVRMALHTGTAELHDGDYFGLELTRVARLVAASHGGQVRISEAMIALVRDHLLSRRSRLRTGARAPRAARGV